jgi:hypothetical protein
MARIIHQKFIGKVCHTGWGIIFYFTDTEYVTLLNIERNSGFPPLSFMEFCNCLNRQ